MPEPESTAAGQMTGMPAAPDAAGMPAPAQADRAATMPMTPPAGATAPSGMPDAGMPPAGAWPSAPPGYGAPPSAPYGYPPYGQGGPPSMPLAPGQGYTGYPTYPGFVPLPPRPAKRDLTPWLIGGLVAVIVLVVGGVGALLVGAGGFAVRTGGSGVQGGGMTPVVVASPSPGVPAGQTVVYQDSLTSGATGWVNDSHCSGQTDGYHIKDGYYCLAPAGALGDFTVTVTVQRISGPSNYPVGLVFRAPTLGQYYELAVYGDGVWAVFKRPSQTAKETKLVDFTQSAAIGTGYNTSNTLSIQAQGAHFVFFANGQRLGEISDAAFTKGKIGLVAGPGVEAVYTNIMVTTPQ